MTDARTAALPLYTRQDIKDQLIANGCSGTVYAMVIPESEASFARAMDGCVRADILAAQPDAGPAIIEEMRDRNVFTRYREPWMQHQDAMHREWFDLWMDWAAPVVGFDRDAFRHRYPTAGASEGIHKLMSEYLGESAAAGRAAEIHMFSGDYEGFAAIGGEGLHMKVVRHDRDDWRTIDVGHGQFWISQPSAIDGMVWDEFDAFCRDMAERNPDAEIVPDLSYVGAVARDYRIELDHPNIRSFVVSQSKPFSGYYHRCGGVFAREARGTLTGNVWFKHLLSLAWGVDMMRHHDVHDLPRRYADHQKRAVDLVGERLGMKLRPADIYVLALGDDIGTKDPVMASLVRGTGSERVIRLCVTPTMSALIHPRYAPGVAKSMGIGA